MKACLNCGTPSADENPTPAHCQSCGDWPCDECGRVNNLATGESCPCWTSLEGMTLADIKALFADDCDRPGLSIDTAEQVGGEQATGLILHVPLDRVRQDNADSDVDLNVGTDYIDVPMVIDPDMPERGKYDYAHDGSRVIRLREWNEQVLLHELLHAALDHVLPRSTDDPHGHNIIARAEVALWETGWRMTPTTGRGDESGAGA